MAWRCKECPLRRQAYATRRLRIEAIYLSLTSATGQGRNRSRVLPPAGRFCQLRPSQDANRLSSSRPRRAAAMASTVSRTIG